MRSSSQSVTTAFGNLLSLLFFMLLGTACNSDLQVTADRLAGRTSVEGFDKLSTHGGDDVIITGTGLDSNLKADIAGQKADLKIISKTEGILTISRRRRGWFRHR